MKILRMAICVLLIFFLFVCSSGKHIERHAKSPSLLDLPDQGLYYGFIVNNSSHIIEVAVWPMEQDSKRCLKTVLQPAIPSIKKRKNPVYLNKIDYDYRPHNVIALRLKLGSYKISIRNRDDLIDEGQAGGWKDFIVVLDREYVDKSRGPFTFDIEDAPCEM